MEQSAVQCADDYTNGTTTLEACCGVQCSGGEQMTTELAQPQWSPAMDWRLPNQCAMLHLLQQF